MILTYLLHPAVSISDFARALILDFSFVGKIRVIPSITDSILCSPIPAISRSHIRASRQSSSLDVVGFERGIKFMSPSVRMGVSAFWIAVHSICITRDVHARNR